MKKDQNLPNKNTHSNYSSGKQLPKNSNYTRQHSAFYTNYRGGSPYQRNSLKFSQNRYSRSHSRNSQYRKTIQDQIQTNAKFCLIPVPIQI